jgi:sodium/pantothenate symporter
MRYLHLIADRPLTWALFLVYLVLTAALAWLGHRRTHDLRTYAIGGGDMSPLVVGVTLAASIASTATFVINPGFVYVHGLAALMHLGVAVGLGLITGLLAMSVGFRRFGARSRAVTLPAWVGERYRSRGLAVLFAGVNLLSLSFVVLIVGGVSIVMQENLGLTNVEALVLTVGFVFSYVLIGGTYAHAYTNTFQGLVMLVVAIIVIASGLPLFGHGLGHFADQLRAADPNLTKLVNPASPLFGSFFSVYVSGFVIGFALVCQPHILTKALYVEDDRTLWKSLAIAIAIGLVFSGMLLVGLYARVADLPREAFLDPATGVFRQDRVLIAYLSATFSPGTLALVTVALLAASMSTLDGILVALSSIVANDLVLPLWGRRLPADPARRAAFGHRASQLVLVVMGVAAFAIALHPPRLLGIFGQVGVYGIVAAATAPILFGIAFPRLGARAALTAALVGLGLHFGLYAGGASANPAVCATWALLASGGLLAAVQVVAWVRAAAPEGGALPDAE